MKKVKIENVKNGQKIFGCVKGRNKDWLDFIGTYFGKGSGAYHWIKETSDKDSKWLPACSDDVYKNFTIGLQYYIIYEISDEEAENMVFTHSL